MDKPRSWNDIPVGDRDKILNAVNDNPDILEQLLLSGQAGDVSAIAALFTLDKMIVVDHKDPSLSITYPMDSDSE